MAGDTIQKPSLVQLTGYTRPDLGPLKASDYARYRLHTRGSKEPLRDHRCDAQYRGVPAQGNNLNLAVHHRGEDSRSDPVSRSSRRRDHPLARSDIRSYGRPRHRSPGPWPGAARLLSQAQIRAPWRRVSISRPVRVRQPQREQTNQLYPGTPSPNPYPIISPEEADNEPFDPANVEDARKRILRSIAQRRGQKAFRNNLIVAYDGRCAITGCSIRDVLEAAHIYPYRGPDTNKVANGLLLRADLHTLFDCGLLAVDTSTMTVIVAPQLRTSEYAAFQGVPLVLTA